MNKPSTQLKLLPFAAEPDPQTRALEPRRVTLESQPEPDQGQLTGPGIAIDPAHIITSLEDAIEKLGRELGRLGTILDQVTDLELIGNFSQLYGQNIARYADLLLKQKMLQAEGCDSLLELLGPALDRLDEETELDL